MAANIYLYYVFDLWVHQWRQRSCQGEVRLIRYVDGIVVGFETHPEAEQFQEALGQRCTHFGFELHPEKTCLMEFGRFARERRHKRGMGKPKSFDFLGFTHLSGQSRRGRFQVERRTMAQCIRAKLAEVKGEPLNLSGFVAA